MKFPKLLEIYFKQVGPSWAKVRNRADWQKLEGFKEFDKALGKLHRESLKAVKKHTVKHEVK